EDLGDRPGVVTQREDLDTPLRIGVAVHVLRVHSVARGPEELWKLAEQRCWCCVGQQLGANAPHPSIIVFVHHSEQLGESPKVSVLRSGEHRVDGRLGLWVLKLLGMRDVDGWRRGEVEAVAS